jgi:hypothetical protein
LDGFISKIVLAEAKFSDIKNKSVEVGRWWLMSVILAAQEAEIRRIEFGSQPGQIGLETLS